MVEHVNIPDGEIHEPKGVSTAASGEVYVADGAGSGAWTAQTVDADKIVLSGVIEDVSTASTIYFPLALGRVVTNLSVVLGGAITGTNATLTVARGSAAPGPGSLTIVTAGSGAGSTFTTNFTDNNTISAPDYISVTTDGASTDPAPAYVSLVIEVE